METTNIVILIVTIIVCGTLVWVFVSANRQKWSSTTYDKKKDEEKKEEEPKKAEKEIKKDAEKKTKESGKTSFAGKLVRIFVTLLFVGAIAMLGINLWQRASESASRPTGKTISNLSPEETMEMVLWVICKYESGCRQFESDGKTPLKNKGIPEEGVPPSSAFGKYQFLESHREPAKKLGFDLNTEAGQDGYARWLWQNDGRTKHWENNPKSYRWQTELMSFGYDPWGIVEGAVTAKPGEEFGREVTIHSGVYVGWSTDGGGIEIKNQLGKTARFDPEKGIVTENIPYPSTSVAFRSLGDKPVEVKLRFSRTPLVKMSSIERRDANSAAFFLPLTLAEK